MVKKTKKCISVALALIMMLSVFCAAPASASAADNQQAASSLSSNGFEYTVSNSKATITGYTGSATNLTIPSSLGGYTVDEIGSDAFNGNKTITSITIPNSVMSIGWKAFADCKKVTTVSIGSGVKNMDRYAFAGCVLLTKVNISSGTTIIGWGAFSGCTSLKTVTIPNTVTEIGTEAFNGCTLLTGVTIPGSVKSIGDYAFNNCKNMSSLSIGNGVTEIGGNVFENCINLTSITIPNSVTSIGWRAFADCKKVTTVSIGSGVDSMDRYAFAGCVLLTKVNISSGTTIIGWGAFSGCTSLKTVTIPNTVTEIGTEAFNGCTLLTGVTIPGSVKSIGDYAFNNCKNMSSLSIGNGVTEIGGNVFENCINLTSITIPNSVTSIGWRAFADCKKVTTVSIGSGVDSMDSYAFAGCSTLNKVTIAAGTTVIGYGAFDGCTSLTAIAIPDPFIQIGSVRLNDDNLKDSDVFYNCPSTLTIYGKANSFAQQFAKANGIKFSTSGIPQTVMPTSISVSPTSLSLTVGGVYTLRKTISPSNATTTVTWLSSNKNVATVDKNGKVTAKAAGTATITVRTSNGKSANCKVTVKSVPSSVKLSRNKATRGVGDTYQLKATVSPNNAVTTLTWSSSNSGVVSVDKNGKITPKKPGTATITVRTSNGKSANCKVTVKSAPSSVKLSRNKATRGVGDKYQLTATLTKNSMSTLKWSSSNSKVVSVDKNGKITPKKTGTAVITVRTHNGKTANCTVKVKSAPSSVKLSKSSLNLKSGKSFQLKAVLSANSMSTLKWSSSNKKVATVDKNGKIIAKNAGTAVITVKTHNGRSATCKITVKK